METPLYQMEEVPSSHNIKWTEPVRLEGRLIQFQVHSQINPWNPPTHRLLKITEDGGQE